MPRWIIALTVSTIAAPAGAAGAAVIISEIHYHPPSPDSARLEFVEIHNASNDQVSLGGWRFESGIRFVFPPGAVLPAGAFAVVARNPAALAERFALPGSLPAGGILGKFEGALDNEGETITLVDASGALADSITYDDNPPWPVGPNGMGRSLGRLCATAPTWDRLNWAEAEPTPAAANRVTQCPPPAHRPPPIAINEIHYHPVADSFPRPATADGEDLEFVELYNPADSPADVAGWRFTDGIDFTFPAGTSIPPRGYLAVCRSAAAVRERFRIENAIGDYTGKLSNRGERVTLSDAGGAVADSVRYGECGDWPYGADGEGRSLERISAADPGDDPANWSSSRIDRSVFHRFAAEGIAGVWSPARVLIALDGQGEAIIDDVVLEDLRSPGANLLSNGHFNGGLNGWTVSGIAARSGWEAAAGADRSGALRLRSSGPCPAGECGISDGASFAIEDALDPQGRYRVTLAARPISGRFSLRLGLRGGFQGRETLATPGRPNTAAAASFPPAIDHVGRNPIEPTSADEVAITARVRAGPGVEVTLVYEVIPGDGSPRQQGAVEMADDGLSRDGAAGDGVFGGVLPPFPHGSQVRHRILAREDGRLGESDHPLDPGAPLEKELFGYYVSDRQPQSQLPVYHILLEGIDGEDWQSVNSYLNCSTLRRGAFAFRGDLYPGIGVRFRGNTACLVNKRNFKVAFNRGRLFRNLEKINLNSLWTDKALVREHLAWDFFRELGAPYCETEYVRLHVSGEYYGLYLYVEHPDRRFLERNGLQADANLYKARQPLSRNATGVDLSPDGMYANLWEEETNPGGDYSDVAEFIDSMHADGGSPGGPSADFWRDRSLEDMIIAFQIGQVVLNNIDSSVKNHFLYHDLAGDRWGFITWDMDLTFGKFFSRNAVNFAAGRQVGTLNDLMLSDIGFDLDPWIMTSAAGGEVDNWLLDFFFRAGHGRYQRAYLVRLWSILEEKYRNDLYNPRLDRLAEVLAAEEREDHERWGRYPSNVPGYPEEMLPNIEIIKNQISLHREFLRQYILRFHPEVPLLPRLKITEVMYLPEQDIPDLEFIELVNVSQRAVDLSGWTISGIDFIFPEGARVPAGGVVVAARSPQAFLQRYPGRSPAQVFGPFTGRLADDGEVLEVRDAGPGHPAVVDFLHYESGGEWPEVERGQSIELAVSALEDNDLGSHWKASAEIGGSPGSITLEFFRGDASGDARIDISDAIHVLSYLFLGGETPHCLDAADADDSGGVDLTDPVYLLTYLFLGGSPPPPPHRAPGPDPTPDLLECSL